MGALLVAIAHTVRIITIPPVMVGILLTLVYTLRDDVITTAADMIVSLMGLTVLPILAYPVAFAIPSFRKKGRAKPLPPPIPTWIKKRPHAFIPSSNWDAKP